VARKQKKTVNRLSCITAGKRHTSAARRAGDYARENEREQNEAAKEGFAGELARSRASAASKPRVSDERDAGKLATMSC